MLDNESCVVWRSLEMTDYFILDSSLRWNDKDIKPFERCERSLVEAQALRKSGAYR